MSSSENEILVWDTYLYSGTSEMGNCCEIGNLSPLSGFPHYPGSYVWEGILVSRCILGTGLHLLIYIGLWAPLWVYNSKEMMNGVTAIN